MHAKQKILLEAPFFRDKAYNRWNKKEVFPVDFHRVSSSGQETDRSGPTNESTDG